MTPTALLTVSILAYLIIGIVFVSYGNHKGWFDEYIMCFTYKPPRLYLGFLVTVWPVVFLVTVLIAFVYTLGSIPSLFESNAEGAHVDL